jgi:hypothetical protein
MPSCLPHPFILHLLHIILCWLFDMIREEQRSHSGKGLALPLPIRLFIGLLSHIIISTHYKVMKIGELNVLTFDVSAW